MTERIAFFDVDYTICRCYTGFPTTFELIRRGIVKKRRIPVALGYRLGAVFHDGNIRKMYETAVRDVAGSHVDDVSRIGREIFESWVYPQLYVDTLDEIQRVRRDGARVVLISSGPDMVVRAVGEFVRADAVYSNGPVVGADGVLQSIVSEPLCHREGKLVLASAHARDAGVRLEDCAFYSDSSSDLPLMDAVGEAVAVNPDRRLRRIARERGWRVAEFRRTLGVRPPARYASRTGVVVVGDTTATTD